MTDHGYTSGGPPPGIAGDTSSFPTDAEYARSLAHLQGRASLSTLTAQGYPFGSVVSYVCTSLGEPVVCISSMAEHTINARNDQRASVLIAEPVPLGADPLASARLTLVGDLVEYGRVPDELRSAFLDRHPSARFYVDYTDFSWWRLVPTAVRFVGGFGHMSWVGVPEYTAAEPDPLGQAADGICQHMNDDHRSAEPHVRAGAGRPGRRDRRRHVGGRPLRFRARRADPSGRTPGAHRLRRAGVHRRAGSR